MEKKIEIRWINCAKFVAILAVMVDHLNHVLYTNQNVAVASYFSVSLFIILAGMTAYMSDLRHNESYIQSVFRGCRNLVVSYLIATAIYQVYFTHYFDFSLYVDNVIHFKVSMHLYFVLLYIQLNLANRFFFGYLQKCQNEIKGYFCELLMFVVVVIFAIVTTNYTNILGVYGGGGKLLGGTYLILYYLGMIIEKHKFLADRSVKKSIYILLFSGAIWFAFWKNVCVYGRVLDQYFPYADGFNPPSVTLFIFSLCVLGMTFGFFTFVEKVRCVKWSAKIAGWIGERSMAIFLYHMLMVEWIRPRYKTYCSNEQTWVARIVYFSVMIGGSILIDILVKYLLRKMKMIVIFKEKG